MSVTPVRRRARSLAAMLLIIAAGCPPAARAAGCVLGRMAQFPITMQGLRPVMSAAINGTDVQFVVDSGAFYSIISPASAEALKLKTYPAPFGFFMRGVGGGSADAAVATVKILSLSGVPLHDIQFLVGGSDVGSGNVGVIGQNVLHIADVEYDFAGGMVRLMKPVNCGKAMLAYWVKPSEPYSMIPIEADSGLDRHTIGSAHLNGVEIRVQFDTGSPTSALSLRAAARAGINPGAPGVEPAGLTLGLGKTMLATYIARFSSFKIGDEEIKNARLRIADLELSDADMLLGADFFLSHRIYVANSQHRLYFTYNGGPVFNLTAASRPADAGATAPAEAGPGAAESAPDAADLERRGNAAAARHDFTEAIADLTRACELAPGNADCFTQRGRAYWQDDQAQQARADFDRALQLNPGHVPALLARAALLMRGADKAEALADLNAADAALAREADERLFLAQAYEREDLPDRALVQYDDWIEAHRADARMPEALNGRCWLRALQGTHLDLALADCDAAHSAVPKSSPLFAMIADSRAFVLLRLGRYGKSIADYDEGLKMGSKNPWSLYGRGLDELKLGKAEQGRADMAQAEQLRPTIAEEFARRGLVP